jgi:hypothetical protein
MRYIRQGGRHRVAQTVLAIGEHRGHRYLQCRDVGLQAVDGEYDRAKPNT